MLYTAIDVTLIAALAATSIFSIAMYRELRRFKALSGDFATILRETSRAVEGVERAVAGVQEDGAGTLIALGERIDAARQTLASLRNAEETAAAQLIRLQEKVEKSREVERKPKCGRKSEPNPELEAAPPVAAKLPRIRRPFEWPVVRGDGPSVQDA